MIWNRNPHQWREHFALWWVTLIDGERVRWEFVMRRQVAGRWQYRRRTAEEAALDDEMQRW